MKRPLKNETIVVGGGIAGLGSALLASMRGESVTLLESHSVLGGCASWFKRGAFSFDVGATTISGLNAEEPLGIFFKNLGCYPKLISLDPGIVFHLSNGKCIRYFRDKKKWLLELESNFPGLNHAPFWDLVMKLNQSGWKLLNDFERFPFKNLNDLASVIKYPQYLILVPYLFLSTEFMLKKFGLDTPEYIEMVNGILLISAQAESDRVPFLVGAMGLSYPANTNAPIGGMKGFVDFLEGEIRSRNVQVLKNSRVKSFKRGEVTLSNDEKFNCHKIILNIPIWNQAELFNGEDRMKIKNEAIQNPGHWGALTLYFGMKSDFKELYHQVHLNHPLVKNYFVSFSIPGDLSRAPAEFQSVSISTHVVATERVEKEKIAQLIMNDFIQRFRAVDIKFFSIGTPKTFERFTGRKNGFVGGLPFLLGRNPLSMLSPIFDEEGIFRVGDTIFPGQGICGVIAGALQLHKRLV